MGRVKIKRNLQALPKIFRLSEKDNTKSPLASLPALMTLVPKQFFLLPEEREVHMRTWIVTVAVLINAFSVFCHTLPAKVLLPFHYTTVQTID